jgi:hypothetical protein
MKSQRRHELEHNELADWLAKNIAAVRPYQNLLLGIVVLLAIGGMIFAWWSRRTNDEMAQASDQLYIAVGTASATGNPMPLMEVASKYSGTDVAQFANVVAADLLSESGCNALFSNKSPAREQLRKAIDLYSTVIKQGPNTTIAERATFGRGRAREALGELSDAQQDYESVKKTWPEGTFAAAATSRLSDIERPATKELYDKFAKFNPKPDSGAEPGATGKRPEFKVENPPDEGPVFSSPKLTPKGTEAESPATAATPTPGKAESSTPESSSTQPATGEKP